MPTITNSFGKLTGWNSVTVNMLGRDLAGITEIKYNDETKKESVYGAGNRPIGWSEGNYEATASLTLLEEEVRALQTALPPGQNIQDIAPFDIVVEYVSPSDVILKDRLRNCTIKNNGRELKNDEGSITIELELLLSHIEWNVI